MATLHVQTRMCMVIAHKTRSKPYIHLESRCSFRNGSVVIWLFIYRIWTYEKRAWKQSLLFSLKRNGHSAFIFVLCGPVFISVFSPLFVCEVLFHCRFKKKEEAFVLIGGWCKKHFPPPSPFSPLLLWTADDPLQSEQVWIKRQIIKGSQRSVTVALSWMRAEQLQPHERQLKYQPQRLLLVFLKLMWTGMGTRLLVHGNCSQNLIYNCLKSKFRKCTRGPWLKNICLAVVIVFISLW